MRQRPLQNCPEGIQYIRKTAHRLNSQAIIILGYDTTKQTKTTTAAQIVATFTIAIPSWCQMSLTSYSGQQRMSSTLYPGKHVG